MVGAGICGFNGNTTELCTRWTELGAFYPFSRDHNAIDQIPQERYRWSTVAEASRRALGVCYSLLLYYYTNYQHSVEKGWPVARSLVFEYPDTQVDAFLPRGIWYGWYTHKALNGRNANVALDAPLEHVNVHIRGGSVAPIQEAAMTTTEPHRSASGKLYVDDGETFNTDHRWVHFKFTKKLEVMPRSGHYNISQPLSKFTILGNQSSATKVSVNGKPLWFGSITKSAKNHTLAVDGLKANLNMKTVVELY